MTTPPHPGEPRFGVTGQHTDRGLPNGATTLTPYLGVADVAAAVDYYRTVFDARVLEVTRVADDVIHAHLDLGNGHLHLERPNPVGGLAASSSDGTTSFALGYYCHNVDDVLTKATDHGAELLAPAINFASGDRFAAIRDPFGVRWSIMSRIEDLTHQESAARIAAWANARIEDAKPAQR